MTDELKIAIEDLYKTFAIYTLKSSMEGCPCCLLNADKERLHTKQLRQLEEEDLSRYAFKAMTTWGDTNDFKYYLPRIFELLATTNFIVDTFVVLGKLDYGKWKTWTENEQKSIKDFLIVWWTDLIKKKSYFDKEAFIEIYKLIGNINTLLDRWKINFEDNSFKNFVELIYDYYNDLVNKKNEFKDLDEVSIEKLIEWIKLNSKILETGFFYFEEKDEELSEKISATLYIVERTL
jgi:hypothetical protein